MTMAGKAAEILKYGEDSVSNGPSGDIQQASGLARAMVLRWGMSDKVGNVDYQQAHESYQGNGAGGLSLSAKTKELIEEEVKRFIDEAYDTAVRIIKKKNKEFERLAQGLIEYETLTGDEIKKVMAGGAPMSDDDDNETPSKPTASVTAIPKTKKTKPTPSGDMEPDPA